VAGKKDCTKMRRPSHQSVALVDHSCRCLVVGVERVETMDIAVKRGCNRTTWLIVLIAVVVGRTFRKSRCDIARVKAR
jgi:hypothetical protein